MHGSLLHVPSEGERWLGLFRTKPSRPISPAHPYQYRALRRFFEQEGTPEAAAKAMDDLVSYQEWKKVPNVKAEAKDA